MDPALGSAKVFRAPMKIVAALTLLAHAAIAAALPILPRPFPITTGGGIVPGVVRAKLLPGAWRRMEPFRAYGATRVLQVGRATLRSRIGTSDWATLTIPPGADPRTVAAELSRTPGVAYAEPVQSLKLLIPTPNDPDFTVVETTEPMILLGEGIEFRRLWYLDDVDAMGAWTNWPNVFYTASNKPANAPTIAIIDTGVETDHPDFVNAGGVSGNKLAGGQWDLARSKYFKFGEIVPGGSVQDTMGHGTHVAGLALASGNNGEGLIGLGYAAQGMALKVFGDDGTGSDSDAAAALFYAADNGADVINLSLGTVEPSRLFQEAITYAWQKGCLILCAGNESGNGGGSLGNIYPAASSAALAVTANGPGGRHADDNYAGTGRYIGVAAPGGNLVMDLSDLEDPKAFAAYIYSTTMTTPGSILINSGALAIGYGLNYGYLIGTSMACPIVAGSSAMYMGKYGLRASTPGANLRAFRAAERGAISIYGAPEGSWETHQGYGSFDAEAMMSDTDTRQAGAGAIAGMVYKEGLPTANVLVRARRDGSATNLSTTTSNDGSYRFDQLPPGNFTVTAFAGNLSRVRRAEVVPGSDHPGVDLWAGDAILEGTGPEGRAPTLALSGTTLTIDQWAMDTESGVNDATIRVGTTPGAADVLSEREMPYWKPRQTFTLPPTPAKRLLHVTLRYANGVGMTSLVTGTLRGTARFDAALVSETVDENGLMTVRFRNTGTQLWERNDVHLGKIGNASLSRPVGLFDGSRVRPGGIATFRLVVPAGNPLQVHQYRMRAAGRGAPGLFGGTSRGVRGY